MAVPSSGILSLRGIRNELYNNNYNASNTFSNISLTSMSTGVNGTINTDNSSSNRPNGSAPHYMSEFYSYDHDLVSALLSGSVTVGVDNIYSSFFYGYGSAYFPNMGSASSNLAVNSFGTITAIYWQNSNYLNIVFSGTKPTFSGLSIGGASQGGSSTFTNYSTSTWRKYTTTNPFGTSSGVTKTIVFS